MFKKDGTLLKRHLRDADGNIADRRFKKKETEVGGGDGGNDLILLVVVLVVITLFISFFVSFYFSEYRMMSDSARTGFNTAIIIVLSIIALIVLIVKITKSRTKKRADTHIASVQNSCIVCGSPTEASSKFCVACRNNPRIRTDS